MSSSSATQPQTSTVTWRTEDIARKAIEFAGVLFAAFGSFLLNIAPPEDASFFGPSSFGVGFATVLTCLVALGVWAGGTQLNVWRRWPRVLFGVGIGLAVSAAASGAIYFDRTMRWTIGHPPESPTQWFVKGDDYSQVAKEARESQFQQFKAYPADAALVDGFPNRAQDVWTEPSRRKLQDKLLLLYCLFSVSVSGAIICLAEVVGTRQGQNKQSTEAGPVPTNSSSAPTSKTTPLNQEKPVPQNQKVGGPSAARSVDEKPDTADT